MHGRQVLYQLNYIPNHILVFYRIMYLIVEVISLFFLSTIEINNKGEFL